MNHIKIFIELTRLNKPIGFMLLFWPCSWGLAYAYSLNKDINSFVHFLLLFFLGSVLMRSAGCIFNDIVDRDFDKKVSRTKTRPIASGKISITQSIIYVIALCVLALIILIQFNNLTIILGFGSMFLAFSYQFMKRITYWPQLFLGLTFNWGIIMAWYAMGFQLSFDIILLYISAIFWTLGYDTIYGAQDMSDDEIIGLKSTSIKFKDKMKLFVTICYLISAISLVWLNFEKLSVNISTLILIIFFLSLIYQLFNFEQKKPSSCLETFKMNNFSGFILFLSLTLI